MTSSDNVISNVAKIGSDHHNHPAAPPPSLPLNMGFVFIILMFVSFIFMLICLEFKRNDIFIILTVTYYSTHYCVHVDTNTEYAIL